MLCPICLLATACVSVAGLICPPAQGEQSLTCLKSEGASGDPLRRYGYSIIFFLKLRELSPESTAVERRRRGRRS